LGTNPPKRLSISSVRVGLEPPFYDAVAARSRPVAADIRSTSPRLHPVVAGSVCFAFGSSRWWLDTPSRGSEAAREFLIFSLTSPCRRIILCHLLFPMFRYTPRRPRRGYAASWRRTRGSSGGTSRRRTVFSPSGPLRSGRIRGSGQGWREGKKKTKK